MNRRDFLKRLPVAFPILLGGVAGTFGPVFGQVTANKPTKIKDKEIVVITTPNYLDQAQAKQTMQHVGRFFKDADIDVPMLLIDGGCKLEVVKVGNVAKLTVEKK